MLHFVAAVAMAATAGPAPLSVFDKAIPVDGSTCAIISKVDIAGVFCCESCHHPYLITSEAVELSVVATDTAFSASKTARVDLENNGSGELVAAESTSVVAVAVLKELEQKITLPCGRCITVEDCSAQKGRLELWHHQCLV